MTAAAVPERFERDMAALNEENLSVLYDGPIGLREVEGRFFAWPKNG